MFDKMYREKQEETECKRMYLSGQDESETECKKLDLSEPVPQISSTPKIVKCRLDDSDESETIRQLRDMVTMLTKEIDTLKKRFESVEGQKATSAVVVRQIPQTYSEAVTNSGAAAVSTDETIVKIVQSPVKRLDGASSSQTPKRPTQKQTKSRNKTAAVSTQNTPTPDSKMTEPKSTLIIGSSITGKIRTRGLRSNARVRTSERGTSVGHSAGNPAYEPDRNQRHYHSSGRKRREQWPWHGRDRKRFCRDYPRCAAQIAFNVSVYFGSNSTMESRPNRRQRQDCECVRNV